MSTRQYKNEIEKCVDVVFKIRSNALCSTCSGRSKQFFDKDRGLVTESICRSVLDSCSQTYENLLLIIENVGSYLDEFEKLSEMIKNTTRKDDIPKVDLSVIPQIKESYSKLNTHNLVELLRKYINSKGKPSLSLTADLCQITVALSSTPILNTLASLIRSYIKPISSITFDYGLFIFRNTKLKRRILNIEPDLTSLNPFGGDAKMYHSSMDSHHNFIPNNSNYAPKEINAQIPLPIVIEATFP